MRALLCLLALILTLPLPLLAQEMPEFSAGGVDRSSTGGAQTLEDIMARQRGEKIDDSFRRDATGDPDNAKDIAQQLGTLGGASDPELWRALRYNSANISVSSGGDVGKVLVQDGGMKWYNFRQGTIAKYGAWLLLGTLALLAVFFLLRGRVKLDHPKTGRTVTRFQFIERFAHWMMAGSFILLGLTGLFVKYGRDYIAPYLGKDFNASLLVGSKMIHNNVAWAFILSLAMVFVMWVWHNLPSRTDLKWVAMGGGIIGSKHPPAKKFNAGQKIIFWSCILLGGSISLSGLSLLFPFELSLFEKTFRIINDLGLPGLFNVADLPTNLSPHQEMQFAQSWHSIVSFVLMAIILAHIYIGTLGMEGAYDAMGTGEVDVAWAEQHHSLWLDKVQAEEGTTPPRHQGTQGTPAE